MARRGFDERSVPWKRDPHFEDSCARYEFANRAIGTAGKTAHVLDLCCGPGHGTKILSNAEKITAVDNSREAVELAKKHARHDAVVVRGNAESLKFANGSFDAVICLEGLEHVEHGEKVLDEIRRVLKPGGVAVISTPNKTLTSPNSEKPHNPFHFKEYTAAELRELLDDRFSRTEIFGHKKVKASERTFSIARTAYRAIKPLVPKALVRLAFSKTFGKEVEPLDEKNPAHYNLVAVCRK